ADGSGLVFLTNEASDAQPTWSPDGTRIAFISSRNGRSGVYVLNAGVPTLLTNTPRAVSKPAWSPDGTRLAFTCEVDSGNSDICVINANGTGFTRLTSDPGQDAGPAWKPDGSRIAFATTRYAGAYELASMTPDGGDVTRLSPATAASEPAWKTDGGVTPAPTPAILASAVADNPSNVLSAVVTGRVRGADSVAVRYGVAGSALDSATPAVTLAVDSVLVPVLGLLPDTRYLLRFV